jgi:hypothetical protein
VSIRMNSNESCQNMIKYKRNNMDMVTLHYHLTSILDTVVGTGWYSVYRMDFMISLFQPPNSRSTVSLSSSSMQGSPNGTECNSWPALSRICFDDRVP